MLLVELKRFVRHGPIVHTVGKEPSLFGNTTQVFGPVVKPHYIIRFGCVVDSKYENSDQAEGSAASVKAAGTDESVSATTEDVLKEEVLIEQKNSDYTKMLEELDMPEGTALYAVVGTIKYVVEVGLIGL